MFARELAILYTLLALMGLPFMPGAIKTTSGLIPLYGADTLLHIGTAAIAAYLGLSRLPSACKPSMHRAHVKAGGNQPPVSPRW